jgi:uncharacterized membrane protein (UPF0127 family)
MIARMTARRFRLAALLAAFGSVAPPVAALDQDAETRPSVITVQLVSAAGTHDVKAEVACTREERARGLMGRRSLAPDQGMIFLYATPRELRFWMKNTPLSLDIIFINVSHHINRIAEDTKPMSENPIASDGPVSAVLELAAGRAGTYGLAVGDRVRYDASAKGCD